jgi:hypothetical protein
MDTVGEMKLIRQLATDLNLHLGNIQAVKLAGETALAVNPYFPGRGPDFQDLLVRDLRHDVAKAILAPF